MAMRPVVLHMGFMNIPYTKQNVAAPMAAAKAYASKRRGSGKTKTTEQVADILEVGYGIVNVFNEMHGDEILEPITEAAEDIVVDILAGNAIETEAGFKSLRKPISSKRMVDYMKPKTKEIEKMFRTFLDREEMNNVVTGVPTDAAKHGIRTGRKSRALRPSFIDTGLYRAAFQAWVDIK